MASLPGRRRAIAIVAARVVVSLALIAVCARVGGWVGFLALIAAYFTLPDFVLPSRRARKKREAEGPRTLLTLRFTEAGERVIDVVKVLREFSDASASDLKAAVLAGDPIELEVPESTRGRLHDRLAQFGAHADEQVGSTSGEGWFTVADGADPVTVEAAYRGALDAVRHRLRYLQVDVHSDEDWPAEVQWAVDAAQEEIERRTARKRRVGRRLARDTITLDVDPTDDDGVAIVRSLAPFTIAGTGIDTRGRLVWSADDTGTSAAFRLDQTELLLSRAAITDAGGDSSQLVPLHD